MSLLMPAKGQEFTPTPAGNHFATCYRVVDLGTQDVDYQGQNKKQHKVMLSWEIPGELTEEGKPCAASKRYTLSSSDKSTFRKHLESWRGRPFTESEFGTFDVGTLIGVNCFLNIVHEEKNGNTYSNILSVTALPKGMNLKLRQEPINKPVYFSLNSFDQKVYDSLSDSIKATIAKSPEYQRLKGAHEIDRFAPEDANGIPDYLNDEIPF